MSRSIAVCSLLSWISIWMSSVICAPWILSDHNKFLEGFVNQELLSLVGFIVTITLGSAFNVFLELKKIEDGVGEELFQKTKRGLKQSSEFLIFVFCVSLIIVIIKPIVINGERSEALLNGFAISSILVSVLVLIDLTQTAFGLDLHRK